MKNREEIISRIEDAWVLEELLCEEEVFEDDILFDKAQVVIKAFANIIYDIVGVEEEEQDEIQERIYKKAKTIKYLMEKTEQ